MPNGNLDSDEALLEELMTIFRKHSSTEQIGRTRFEITSLLDLFKPHPKILVRKSEYKNGPMGMRVAEILENKEKGEVLSLSVRINRYRLMPILGQVNTPEELWGILDELDGKIIDDSGETLDGGDTPLSGDQ